MREWPQSPFLFSQRRRPIFTPASLFANGEKGAWYDPSDLTSMFQDHLGTTPAAIGAPIGLMRDKSGNGNHARQPTSTARPTLGRMPKGGVRNSLVNSEDFSAGWVRGAYDTTPKQVLPGIMGVDVAASERQYAVYDRTNSAWIVPPQAWPIASGRFSATFTAPPGCVEANVYVTRGNPQLSSSISNSTVVPGQTYTVSWHVNNGRVGGIQRELGPTMTPYQRVDITGLDVTEDGVESLPYLSFDGVDDSLLFSPINLNNGSVGFAGVIDYSAATLAFLSGSVAGYMTTRKGGWSRQGSSVYSKALSTILNATILTNSGSGMTVYSGGTEDFIGGALIEDGLTSVHSLMAFNGTGVPSKGNIFALIARSTPFTANERQALFPHLAKKSGITL